MDALRGQSLEQPLNPVLLPYYVHPLPPTGRHPDRGSNLVYMRSVQEWQPTGVPPTWEDQRRRQVVYV
jgi:hypothetical protein